jgi:hypothetical protein
LASSDNVEGYKALTERLKEEYGEPIKIKRGGIIPMERDAWHKLRALNGGD